jgi:hypothetical protein
MVFQRGSAEHLELIEIFKKHGFPKGHINNPIFDFQTKYNLNRGQIRLKYKQYNDGVTGLDKQKKRDGINKIFSTNGSSAFSNGVSPRTFENTNSTTAESRDLSFFLHALNATDAPEKRRQPHFSLIDQR